MVIDAVAITRPIFASFCAKTSELFLVSSPAIWKDFDALEMNSIKLDAFDDTIATILNVRN